MTDETTELDDARAALDDARRRLTEVPPQVVVTNHAMGLYELAAIHLSADPPNLTGAQLAIDAVRALVEGLGDRLGDEVGTLRTAVANIQMAYVEVSRRPVDDGVETAGADANDEDPSDPD
ncbi:MAG: hypothetical protein M3337_02665 [Actinomycetota bacterium]|nr:hypothetical protein [Actinomycetota bacterium]